MVGMQWPSAISRPKARKTGHLQISNQARGLTAACGLKEPLGGVEDGYVVPKRFDHGLGAILRRKHHHRIEINGLNVR
jgi:hypothetical protein